MTLLMRDSMRPQDLMKFLARALNNAAAHGQPSATWLTAAMTSVGASLTEFGTPPVIVSVTGGGSIVTLSVASLDDSGNPVTFTMQLTVS